MSDEDVYSLVAFLNTLPPVEHRVPRSHINFPVSLLIKSEPQPAGSIAEPDRSDRVKYGEYLATLSGCGDCHTPAKNGKPIDGMAFAGGEKFHFPTALVVSANITPDPETGIGRWSEQDFVDRFREYQEYADHGSPVVGPESFTLMPWLPLSQLPGNLPPSMHCLQTQKAIRHSVDSTHPASPYATSPQLWEGNRFFTQSVARKEASYPSDRAVLVVQEDGCVCSPVYGSPAPSPFAHSPGIVVFGVNSKEAVSMVLQIPLETKGCARPTLN